jgi:aspartyl-tRNA(Asn)/glutamyl-tRNA(Gln) amidotransferase subunit A
MLGKLNMDEFAMGSSNETSGYGPVLSPWRRNDGGNAALTPGGSSGGSASAVAARLAPGVTGTDTGGSIRQPAAFTGITGIKPTYGRCSRWGIVAFASSLDQAGPMARDVRDCAIMLEAMAGFDPKDSTSLKLDVPNWEANLSADVRGKRIGIPKEYRIDGVPAEIDAVWEQGIAWLRDAGARSSRSRCRTRNMRCRLITSSPRPRPRPTSPAMTACATDCACSRRRAGSTTCTRRPAPAGFGAEVKRRIMIGTYVLSAGFYDAYFNQAQKVRALIARDFEQVWEQCDLLLTPTAPSAAFGLGEKMDDPIAMYLNDVFAVPASLAGLPAISVPAGLDAQGLPLGLQIVGKALDEQGVLDAALAFEERAGFTARAEAWW